MHTERQERSRQTHLLTPDKKELARTVLEEIRRGRDVMKTLRSHPIRGGGYLNKSMLVSIYNEMVAAGELEADAHLLERIRMKPMRTLSGVTTVTVLTKPYPCPGKCIFCPTDVRMPKSYLPDEPGAMRGLEHQFDPYAQVRSRMDQLMSLGHPTDKLTQPNDFPKTIDSKSSRNFGRASNRRATTMSMQLGRRKLSAAPMKSNKESSAPCLGPM